MKSTFIAILIAALCSASAFARDENTDRFEILKCSDGSYAVQKYQPSFIKDSKDGNWYMWHDCGLTLWAALREVEKGREMLRDIAEEN